MFICEMSVLCKRKYLKNIVYELEKLKYVDKEC